jgi:cytochrome P450
MVQALRYNRDPLGFLATVRQRYGDVFSINIPYFGRVVYLADPELIKVLFTGSPDAIHGGEGNMIMFEPGMGPTSVLVVDDELHLRERKLLLPPFHGALVRRWGERVRAITEREIARWPVGKPFKLHPRMRRISMRTILEAIFGVRGEDRLELGERITDAYLACVAPLAVVHVLRRNLGPIAPRARFERASAAFDEFLFEEIASRRREAEAEKRDDILSELIRARPDDGPASDEELRDQLITIVRAGHETTGSTLAWAIERLLRTPVAMARLRASTAAGEDAYVDATLKETMRTRPAILDVVRKLTTPLRLDGHSLPAGTFVLPAIATVHHRADRYPQPQAFRPERFLDTKPDGYAWLPFGGGVRRCIGASFAEHEMRIVLRTVVEATELRAPDPRPERPVIRRLTLMPAKGTRVIMQREPAKPFSRASA